MQHENEITIKLNNLGEVDYRYYEKQASHLRSEASAELFGQLIQRAKQLFRKESTVGFRPVSQV